MKNFLKKLFKRLFKPQAIIEQTPKTESEVLITNKLDPTQFYYGYDFQVNSNIVIHQPSVGCVVKMGESDYYKMIHSLTAIPQDHMAALWDEGVDFTKISELEFFYQMTRKIDVRHSEMFFGGSVNLLNFEPYTRGDELVLYDKSADIVIDSDAQKRINEFLCQIHRLKKIRYKPAGRMAKEAMIQIDRDEKKELAAKQQSQTLFPLISSLVNHPGFKYNREETLPLNMFFFMDSVSRIATKEQVDRLATGYYSGSLDPKKFKPETQLNWMRDLYE